MSLWHDVLTLWRNRELLLVLTRRELSSRFAGSMAGVLWAYLQPLLMVGAYFLVFDVVFAMRMGDQAATTRLGTYLVVGAIPWMAFAEAITRGARSLTEAGPLLQKNAMPPVLFVARSVLASLFVFGPMLLALALGYGFFHKASWALLALPGLFLLQGVLSLLCAGVLAILTVALRDTFQVLEFVLSVGFYVSPVLFPLSMFPVDWRWVLYINPMTPLVLAYQSVLLQGQWPAAANWAWPVLWCLVLAGLLAWLLSRSREVLVDWL